MNIGLVINGKECASENNTTFERISPLTGTAITDAAAATKADALRAVRAASEAFDAWSEIGPLARRRKLFDAANILSSKSDLFAQLMVDEIGATPGWGHFNVALASDILREAGSMTTNIQGDIIPSEMPGKLAMALRQPAGVVLGIAPWNAPVILGVRALAMPLACGNTVILKASEVCPATHHAIADVFKEAEFPDGVVNFLSVDRADASDVVETIIAQPAVRRINFTGSTEVGRIIAQTAAKYLKPILLELGGKAPVILLDDADLDEAVAATTFGAFMNQGQICMSTERVLVDETIANDFVERLRTRAEALRVGDPREGACHLGSLYSETAANRVSALIEDARTKGGNIVCGGEVAQTYVSATIVDRVAPNMKLYSEESFGPIVSVIRTQSDDEAVRIANDTDYGLSAAVFSRDVPRAFGIAKRIKSGICHINSSTVADEAQMPFGGVKASGYGRFGGSAAINEFTDLRWVTVAVGAQHYPI